MLEAVFQSLTGFFVCLFVFNKVQFKFLSVGEFLEPHTQKSLQTVFFYSDNNNSSYILTSQ